MATAAQLKAKANFKKAIEYRKKTGCSLKEAFAAVYQKKATVKKSAPKKKVAKKKVAGYVKTAKKGNTTAVIYKKTATKKTRSKEKKYLSYKGVQIMHEPIYNEYFIIDKIESEYNAPTIKTLAAAKKRVDMLLKKKISGVKKKAVSRHKDTNSHNVKISVVSGVNKAGNLAKYGGLIRDERVKKVAIDYCKNRLKQLPVKERPALRRVIKQHEAELKNIKAQMALQKKLI